LSGTPRSSSLRLLLFLGALVSAGMLIPSRFAVSVTPSTDHRVFFLKQDPSWEELRKGAYVLFDVKSKYIDGGLPRRAIKKIACAGGDKISMRGETFYCNGREIAIAKTHSIAGEKLPRFFHNGHIPEDRIFVTGQHRDSYDSRYFGFVKKEEVKALACPLF